MNQLWIYALKTLPVNEQAKNEMLEYCKDYYQRYKKQLENIEVFRNCYNSNNTIEYYTPESFIYKILNKALYTENIELLYKFRFFIIDLCAQLAKEKENLISDELIILYRNQFISKEKFEVLKENIGSLLTINGFLLTSCNKQPLKLPSWLKDTIQIQMTIQVNPARLNKVIFANIKHMNEQEVLFSMGTVFRIDTCEYDEKPSLGKLCLTATDEGETVIRSYLDTQKDQVALYSSLILVGRFLLIDMNDIRGARKYFQMLLNTLPNDHSDIADIYNQIGITHYISASRTTGTSRKSELNQALDMFEKALEIRKNIYGENHSQIAASFNGIGSVYNDRGEYDRALEYYQQGLQILQNNQIEGNIANIIKANLLRNCGVREERMDHYETAISFYIEADQVYSCVMHAHHATHIQRALHIAELAILINDVATVRKYYQRAFDCCEAMWIPTDNQFKELWFKLVRHYFNSGHQEEAIIYLNRVLKMCEKDLSSMQETSNEYILYMIRLCEVSMKFPLALDYYKILFQSDTAKVDEILTTEPIEDDDLDEQDTLKCIEIVKFRVSVYEKLFAKDDIRYASLLLKIAKLFRTYGSIDLAYQSYQEAFNIYESTTIRVDENDFQTCWQKLIDIYFERKDDRSMIKLLERALKKTKQFSNYQFTEIQCLEYIADKYEANDDIPNALHYLEKALRQVEITKSHYHIRPLLKKFLEFYNQEGQEQIIEKYIQRAVDVCEKDPVELSKCYWLLYEWYATHAMKDIALKYYKCFLLATEENDLTHREILDQIWIDFILISRSGNFQFGPIGESLLLGSFERISHQNLRSPHFKKRNHSMEMWCFA